MSKTFRSACRNKHEKRERWDNFEKAFYHEEFKQIYRDYPEIPKEFEKRYVAACIHDDIVEYAYVVNDIANLLGLPESFDPMDL